MDDKPKQLGRAIMIAVRINSVIDFTSERIMVREKEGLCVGPNTFGKKGWIIYVLASGEPLSFLEFQDEMDAANCRNELVEKADFTWRMDLSRLENYQRAWIKKTIAEHLQTASTMRDAAMEASAEHYHGL